jgi:hypothetical protein
LNKKAIPPMITLLTIKARASAVSFVEIEVFIVVSYPSCSVIWLSSRCFGDLVI